MFRINDYDSNSIINEFRNNSSIIIHEHDFVPIGLKGEEKQQSIICLTCGSFYSEKSGKLLVSAARRHKKLIQQIISVTNTSKK
jgi:predicted nuclease of predicted toxin-antitoxin system